MMNFLCPLLLLTILAAPISGQPQVNYDFIKTYALEHHFSGTIHIQKGEAVQFHESYGFANLQFRVPNTPEIRYKIASITKLFTSVLIMQLNEQGKIDLNSSIKNYLPDYGGQGAEKITIRHLLNHTSGLPYVGPSSKEDALENGIPELQLPHSVDKLISEYYSRDLVNEPGSSFSYSNGEYLILGRIIERIYQKSFAEVLSQQILEPMDMQDSGLLFQYQVIDNLADSYFTMNDSSGLVNDLPVYIENWYSAGAMFSTCADLQKFSRALYSGKLLKQESMEQLLVPGLDQYGFGIWVYDQEVKNRQYKVYKRPGDIMGSRTQFVYLPELDLSIIMLANPDAADLDDFVYQIVNRLDN
jgi:CubicO group peptidase (beta-lactamase class C family)